VARILVVDDEAAIREVVSAILEAEGHEVRQARDGHDALTAMAAEMPEVIVLDLAMPGMDGWRFLEELHSRGLRRLTRVVIVSGRYDPSAVSPLQRARVGHFLPKPFEPESLVAMVDEALLVEPEQLYDTLEHSDDLARLIERVDRVLG
jgi:CheY-like chemotaxis protein